MLLPQLEEAGRDLADGGVCRRARQDTAVSGLARHQQQHADGLCLPRARRAPYESEFALPAVAPRRRDAAQYGVGLRAVEPERR